MELKMETNGGLESAKKQLEDRKYAAVFSVEKKAVYGIAISFSSKDRSIENWTIDKV